MAKSKTPKKTTPKSIKNKKVELEEEIEAPVETPKSLKKGKKNIEVLAPQIEEPFKQSNKNNTESPPVSKKEKIVFDIPAENDIEDIEEEIMELAVQLPRLPCYKSALLQLLDTDKPVILKEPLNLVIQYKDRYEAVEAMERLNGITDSSKSLTAKLRHLGQAVPEKRVVYIPKKAPVDEAISVLKKVYGAHMVEAKTFANESKMMLLSFESEESARAADRIPNKSYHGMELKIGSFFAPKKRALEEEDKKQNASKKQKKEETNGESEVKEEEKGDDEENEEAAAEEENEEAANNENDEDAADDNDEEAADEEKVEEEAGDNNEDDEEEDGDEEEE